MVAEPDRKEILPIEIVSHWLTNFHKEQILIQFQIGSHWLPIYDTFPFFIELPHIFDAPG